MFLHIAAIVISVMIAVCLSIGTWWLAYLTSNNAKAQFRRDHDGRSYDFESEGVRIVAWLMIVWGVFTLIFPFDNRSPGVYYLIPLKGHLSANLEGLLIVLNIVAGTGILKMRRWALWAAAYVLLLNTVPVVIDAFRETNEVHTAAISAVGLRYRFTLNQFATWWVVAVWLLFNGIFLWILLSRRRAFFAACDATNSPPPLPTETGVSF